MLMTCFKAQNTQTCYRREVNPHQHCEEGCDISQNVTVGVCGDGVSIRHRRKSTLLDERTLFHVIPKEIL